VGGKMGSEWILGWASVYWIQLAQDCDEHSGSGATELVKMLPEVDCLL
jgi:hypothetical protein